MLVILKNYKYFAGCRVFVESNKYEYIIAVSSQIDNYFLVPWSIKINSTSAFETIIIRIFLDQNR